MNINTLVLGKYATPETLKDATDRAETKLPDRTIIIVKADDKVRDSEFIVRHEQHMQGDVCDLLWEASRLDSSEPLLVTSSKGYKCDFSMHEMTEDVRIAIYCNEITYAGFKFDSTRVLIEAGELQGTDVFRIYFSTTKEFIELTKQVILLGKIDGEKYTLRTVINQAILNGMKIVVRKLED